MVFRTIFRFVPSAWGNADLDGSILLNREALGLLPPDQGAVFELALWTTSQVIFLIGICNLGR